MATTIKTTFLLKRGTAARWAEVNPILEQGEPGFVYDQNKLKIGDGVTAWNDLPYIDGATGIVTVENFEQLPIAGNPATLYRVSSESILYQYNPTNQEYESLSGGGGNIGNITLINGGNA